jgi:hypothetical protein
LNYKGYRYGRIIGFRYNGTGCGAWSALLD